MLAWAGVFLVVLAAGLAAVLFGNPHELADLARTSAIDGPVGNAGASPAYDGPTAPPTASAMAPPGRVAPVTTSAPLPSPPKDATEGAPGTPPAEAAAISEKPSRPASSTAKSVSASSASPAYDGPTAPPTASAMAPPGRVAPVTTSAPLPSPPKDATEGAPGTPPAEAAAISEKPSRPASSTAKSVSASVSPPAAVSELASDKVARVQLAARMQGLEPGPPIDLPIRLSQGQSRTIYFFTELRGMSGRSVLHRWERNGRMMQERQLHPASQSWRAYTAMTITGDMRGSWRISAVDATTGKVLAGQRFEVE